MNNKNKSVALITGANKGIGFVVARKLGEQNFSIWIGCRNKERGEKAVAELKDAGIEANLLLLDVSDTKSVQQAANFLKDKVDALDVLINNAGIHFGLPPNVSGESVDDMRTIFETNAFGPVRVTQAFLPLLRKSKAARIVMMSSGLGSHALTTDITSENWNVGFAGYCASKSALNMFTLKFAKELLNEGIKVNAADPGLTATDLGGPMATRSPEDAAEIVIRLATLNSFGATGGFFHDGHNEVGLSKHPW